MGEANPSAELRIAFHFSVQAGHPDQGDADTGPVEDNAHMLKAVRRKAFGLIDYQIFDVTLAMAFRIGRTRVPRRVNAAFSAGHETV